MKRALQPSVTNIEVDFQLTSDFKVVQAPAKIPTIFNGEKVVVYGIFKSKATSSAPLVAGLTGTATLKGQILNVPISYSLNFDVPALPLLGDTASSGFDIPVIHHLAAKSLLTDWSNGHGWSSTALPSEHKQEAIKLSIESNVISEHTAFVAYDEDQSRTIEGAIQVWDLAASMSEQEGGIFGLGLRSVAMSGLNNSAFMSGLGPPPAPAGSGFISGPAFGFGGGMGGSMGFAGSMGCPPAPGAAMLPSRQRRSAFAPPPPPPQMQAAFASPPPPKMQAAFAPSPLFQMQAGFVPPPRSQKSSLFASQQQQMQVSSTPQSSTTKKASNSLTTLISLQQAAGFWLLKDISDKVIKKECPLNVSGEVWATILALTYLEIHCAGHRDEWELIAMKADMWLESQTLPKGVTLSSLKSIAKTSF